MIDLSEIIKELTSIQETSKKQGDNLITTIKAIESTVNQVQNLITHIKTLDISYEERKQTLQMLYAITNTLVNTSTDMRLKY